MSALQPWLGVPIEDRLLSGIDQHDGEACWHFRGTIDPSGYGQISYLGNKNRRVHRLAYEVFVGPIPEGQQVDHVCHNRDETCTGGTSCLHRRCINPAHLEAVTPYANALRSRHTRVGRAARENTCRRGHEYTPENTYWLSRGVRECRTCMRARQRKYEARKRAARKGAKA